MAFNTIEITSTLDTETILQLLKTYTYPKNAPWNSKEFNIKHVTEKTYTCEIENNTFKLRARKTNQRRQSRPFGYGKVKQNKKNTTIQITVVPHIGSMIAGFIFFFCLLIGLIASITSGHYFGIIPGVLMPTGLCMFYFLNLKYETKDMKIFITNTLQKII